MDEDKMLCPFRKVIIGSNNGLNHKRLHKTTEEFAFCEGYKCMVYEWLSKKCRLVDNK